MSAHAARDSLTLERLLPAPPERVFAAWTEPDLLARWLCPGQRRLVVEELTVRPGGRLAMAMCDEAGMNNTITGEYRVVEPPHRLVFTWTMRLAGGAPEITASGENTLVTVLCEPVSTGTRLVLTHERFASAAAAAGHDEGWLACLDKLEHALARGPSG